MRTIKRACRWGASRLVALRMAGFLSCILAFIAPAAADAAEAQLLTNVRQITFEGQRAGEGYFSRDGNSMIFQSAREPGNPFDQMYLLDLETGDIRRVSPGHGKTTCGWIHPGGDRVMFASTQDDPEARDKQRTELEFRASGKRRRYSWDYDETYEIYDFDLATGEYRRLTDARGYDAEGAYSPDGGQIVFASNRQAYARPMTEKEAAIFEHSKSYMMDIYIMDADGSNVRQLTDSPGYDGGPFFSADGRKIVWRRFAENGATAEILTMNADGTEQTQVTQLGVMSWAPFFHPSGDYIIFANNLQGFGNFELYLVDAAGRSTPVRVTDSAGFDGLPAFSPDGKRLTWTSGRSSDGSSQIFIADWNDDAARRLLGLREAGTAPSADAALRAAAPPMSATSSAISAADIRTHVERLASEDMEGRLTGTKGAYLAGDYIAAAFRALGLQPAGDDDSYFETFTFSVGGAIGPGNRLAARMGGDPAIALAVDEDWRPLAFSRNGAAPDSGVVFAGYGIQTPASDKSAQYDSYGDADVAGKWVMVLRYLPEKLSAEASRKLLLYADLPYKAAVAERKGAAGLIVVTGPNAGAKEQLVRLTLDPARGAAALSAVSMSDAAAARLLAAAGKDLKNLQDTLDAGESVPAFTLPGVTLGGAVDIVHEQRTGRNVLARLAADAPLDGKAAPAIMIGAHFDHLGRGEVSGSLARESERGEIHYGADDNTSGVAALLEIAQFIVDQRSRGRLGAKRDILFAAWSGEELGIIGSGHHVARLAQTAKDEQDISGIVAAYLNMDMVGRLEQDLFLQGVGSSPVWAREIERRNVPVGLSIVTSEDSYLSTDATSFYLKGVPVLNAFTGPHSQYSTPRDTADTLNYPGAEKVARLFAGIARSLARSETAPEYVRQERVAGAIGRKHLRVYLGTIPDYGRSDIKGVQLSGTIKGGPAEKAGLRNGDIIVRLSQIDIGNIYDFVNALGGLKPDTPTDIVVLRDGAEVSLSIVPAARE